MRIIVLLLCCFAGGGLLAYLICALVIPEEPENIVEIPEETKE